MASIDANAGPSRSQSDALRGRARGVMVGSLIAFGWAYYAASILASPSYYILMAVSAVVSVALLMGSVAIMRLARSMPSATVIQAVAGRRIWLWFSLNLIAEIVLLNIAVNLLAAPDLRPFWIPAISAVVGLHFWPMAVFFRVRSYWFVGAAMMAVAAAATIFILRDPAQAPAMVHGEGLANAVILWSALAAGAVFALKPRRPR